MQHHALSTLAPKGLLCTLALACACAWGPTAAQAARSSDGTATPKRHSNRIKIQNTRSGSEETPAERERRLYRECQGRPNSGMCAGYAYKPR